MNDELVNVSILEYICFGKRVKLGNTKKEILVEILLIGSTSISFNIMKIVR
ncbi:hypothetical protein RV18_GL000365 [Enterococcus termitis]|nr:hypothetical protein RV18_GL000365 [Enterococcus termitis]